MNALEKLVVARPMQALPMSPEEVLLADHERCARHVLTPEVVDALQALSTLQTLESHRLALIERSPQLREREHAVMPVLQGLLQRGLLVSAAELLAAAPDLPAPLPLAPVTLLLTDDAPAVAPNATALETLVMLHGLCGGVRIIADDPVSARAWAEALSERACDVELIDAAARQQWLAALAQDAEDRAALLALAGPDTDAADAVAAQARARNFALLRASGRRLLLLTAEQLVTPSALPEMRPGLDPAAAATRQAWFEGERLALLPAQSWQSVLDWCGRPVAQLVAAGAPLPLDAGDVTGLTAAAVARLGGAARVRAVLFGTCGALDSPHNRWLYTLDRESRLRLCAFDYTRRREGRHLLHGLLRARLLEAAPFAPTVLQVDQACGFESPLGEASALFASSFGAWMDPQGRLLHLPWFLPRQDDPGLDRRAAGLDAFRPGLNRFLAELLQLGRSSCMAAALTDRAATWAAQLQDLAAATVAARQELVALHVAQAQAQLVNALQHQLQTADGAPPAWRDDVVAIVEAQARELLAQRSPALAGFAADEAGDAQLCHVLRQMGDWARRWPQWLARAQA